MDDTRLARIEEKLDEVLQVHSNRLTKLETQAGFFQLALAFIFTTALGLLTKIGMGK